jgi:hypothetical protein
MGKKESDVEAMKIKELQLQNEKALSGTAVSR